MDSERLTRDKEMNTDVYTSLYNLKKGVGAAFLFKIFIDVLTHLTSLNRC